jgi:hypothetical protein
MPTNLPRWMRTNDAKLRQLLERGADAREVAEELGVKLRTAQRLMADVGHARRAGRPSRIKDEDVMRAFERVVIIRNQTYDEAALEVGCCVRTLKRKFREMNARRK